MRTSRRTWLKNTGCAVAAASVSCHRISASEFIGQGPSLKIGIVADPQYADIPTLGTRHYRQSVRKLSDAVEHFNEQRVGMAVNLGDLIDRDWASFEVMKGVLNKAKQPFHHVLGNHDFEVQEARIREVPERVGIPSKYYRVSAPGWRFLFLDTNDVSLYAAENGSDERREAERLLQEAKAQKLPQAQSWNGAIGSKQLAWMREECVQAKISGERVLLFAHHPIYPDNSHNLWNASALKELIAEQTVIAAWMNGHNHAGNYGVWEEVPMITFKGMVETESSNAYALLTLERDGLDIEGIGREPSRRVAFRNV
ncbi:metallophosphoesterase [Pirellulaceae bacterium SH467]